MSKNVQMMLQTFIDLIEINVIVNQMKFSDTRMPFYQIMNYESKLLQVK